MNKMKREGVPYYQK